MDVSESGNFYGSGRFENHQFIHLGVWKVFFDGKRKFGPRRNAKINYHEQNDDGNYGNGHVDEYGEPPLFGDCVHRGEQQRAAKVEYVR